MVGKFVGWVGGSLLTGALALASSGAAAPQHRAQVAPRASQQCVCAPDDASPVVIQLDGMLDSLEARELDAAELASDEASEALDAGSLALDAAQDAREAQEEGRGFRVFSTSDGPGWLGIRMEEITSAKAKELNLPAERGVLITAVVEDSPAAKAGLKAGDVITDFDGQRIEGTLTLQRLVREVPSGRKIGLSIWRDGHSQSLTAEISSRHSVHSGDHDYFYSSTPDLNIQIPAMPAMPAMPAIEIAPFNKMFRMFGAPALGIDAEDLSGQLGNYFGAPDGQGVLVREVMPGLPAEKAGLKAGDVIIRIDGKRVTDADVLRAALREKLSKSAESAESGKAAPPTADLTIVRSGKESTVRVELELPKMKVRSTGRRVAV